MNMLNLLKSRLVGKKLQNSIYLFTWRLGYCGDANCNQILIRTRTPANTKHLYNICFVFAGVFWNDR